MFRYVTKFRFHFREECNKFITVLDKNVDAELDLNQVIPQFTLNNICETALGVKLDDMSEGNEYRKAIHSLEEVLIQRVCNPLMYYNWYFFLYGDYRKHEEKLKIVHDFSSRIIQRKRQQFKQKQLGEVDEFGKKQRYAMLDTLLSAEAEGQIDHQGICDEVNTFMFEGYDTTSTCLIFTLLMLSLNEDVQKKCFEELETLPEDNDEISVFQFNELVYLECVIKESLRMFPSVPFIGRQCVEESVVNGMVMPKETQISIHIYDIMRDPRHFPKPDQFQPERFLPENTVNRHPFAFRPFSAGQRNCIGQKFAILEMKVLLASVIRNFKLLPATQLEDLTFENGIVLRTQQHVKVKLAKRVKYKSSWEKFSLEMFVEILITVPLAILIFRKLFMQLNQNYFILSLCKRIRTENGSPLEDKIYVTPTKTRFGNNFDLVNFTPESIFNFMREASAEAKGRNYLWYFFRSPMYNVVRAEEAEEIFQSPKLITKNIIYELLKPFLGEGLLTSTDQKWHARRKALTPAFHFNVLQSFLTIFKEECNKLVKVFHQSVDKELELNQVIPQFTLNNVCETALGVKLDDITGGIRYRRSIHAIEEVMQQRLCNPFFYNIVYFFLFGDYRKQVDNLKIAHDFSSNIIEKRRSLFKSKQLGQVDEFGQKQRYAMLDTLLAAEAEGQIDHQGICDEVNTFMFEGYDTTSTCLIFTLLMLALHEDVQQRCYEELGHLPEDSDEISLFQFNELFYLECVIKESLRMFPSVPFIGRKCVEESVVNGLIMPKDAQINIHIYEIMRDPRHFPNPEIYDPDRFLPENTVDRHPFAFVPFSAGQRNCIGQKFAILEMKVLLSSVIRNFKVLPATRLQDLVFENGIVLRTQQSIKVKLAKRVK
ncbi:LOW QUALITY PROTEIN: probable cytochrome P450 4ac2 [Drosophila eugracilis]|uniref:LOW QUALITY PROTEIN: probable cytochrome P450 4ac2 n=1 Tax=Drosophila eugracilis TaxID=29029 RepID=UPI001BD9D476|nr:LOW QUALITY PROTEIN: probable cytochrome P450 4ac2 [Drosophila eugracilis]